VSDEEKTPTSRAERSLAFMVAATIGLSVLAFLAVIVGTLLGVRDFGSGLWPTIIFLPLIGLPIGLVLMIVLLVLNMRRRARDARGSR
jgi:1,4-dihydroxy-2-naphthoate octaprenyltransferase